MRLLTKLLIIGAPLMLQGCSLFHSDQAFELEKLSEDVLTNKNKTGISITIVPVEEIKK